MSDQTWYYVEADQRIGPLERAEIVRLINAGTIQPNTAVWTDGMNDWVPAQDQFDFNTTAAVPPLPEAAPGAVYAGAPARTFGEAISVCLNKYVGFKGRASRSEYWYWTLFTVVVGTLASFVDALAFGGGTDFSPVNSIFSLATFLPGLAVLTRRLHDTNRTGWWVGGFFIVAFVFGVATAMLFETTSMGGGADPLFWLAMVGFIGYSIVILVFLCTKGDPGPNNYG